MDPFALPAAAVAKVFEVPVAQLFKGGRLKGRAVQARAALIWYLNERDNMSQREIAIRLRMNTSAVRARSMWASEERKKNRAWYNETDHLCDEITGLILKTEPPIFKP
jgi:hypothetical protein